MMVMLFETVTKHRIYVFIIKYTDHTGDLFIFILTVV